MSNLKNQIYPNYKPFELVYYYSPIEDDNIIKQINKLYQTLLLTNKNLSLHKFKNQSSINICINEKVKKNIY